MTTDAAVLPSHVISKIIARALGYRAVGNHRWARGVRGTPQFDSHWPGPLPYARDYTLGLRAIRTLLTPEQQQGIYLLCLASLIPEWSGSAPTHWTAADGWQFGISSDALLAIAQADPLTRARALVLTLDWIQEHPDLEGAPG